MQTHVHAHELIFVFLVAGVDNDYSQRILAEKPLEFLAADKITVPASAALTNTAHTSSVAVTPTGI